MYHKVQKEANKINGSDHNHEKEGLLNGDQKRRESKTIFENLMFMHPVTQKDFNMHCLLKQEAACFDFNNLNQYFVPGVREPTFLVHLIEDNE